jgi:hypothetical protein
MIFLSSWLALRIVIAIFVCCLIAAPGEPRS